MDRGFIKEQPFREKMGREPEKDGKLSTHTAGLTMSTGEKERMIQAKEGLARPKPVSGACPWSPVTNTAMEVRTHGARMGGVQDTSSPLPQHCMPHASLLPPTLPSTPGLTNPNLSSESHCRGPFLQAAFSDL